VTGSSCLRVSKLRCLMIMSGVVWLFCQSDFRGGGGGEHVRHLGGALFTYSAARLDCPQKSQAENIGKTLYGSWLNTRFSASVKALDIL